MDFSINHIWFPTDFSKNADQALSFAVEIARRTGAKLTLFHSKRESRTMTSFEGATEPLEENTTQKLDGIKENLLNRNEYKDLEVSTVLASGQPPTSLVNHVKDQKPDLIVMGTKGATADRSVLIGSVTTNTINKTDVPVLAIPEGNTYKPFEKITFATDYREGDWIALQQIIHLARIFDSSVDVLHIAEGPSLQSEIKFRGFRELVTTQADYKQINFYMEYELDFFSGVAEYLHDHSTALLVMTKYHKSFWDKITQRNHQKEMAFYTELPLLVLPGDRYIQPSPVFDKAINNQQ